MRSQIVHLLFLLVVTVSQAGLAHAIEVEFSAASGNEISAENRELIVAIAQSTEIEVRELLPDLPAEILLTVSSGRNVIPEIGVGASSLAPGHIEWVVDVNHRDGVDAIVRTQLRSSLFHEMHHLTRGWVISGGGPVDSFMDAVVSEGMATVFEREFAGSQPLWGEYPEEVAAWVDELRELPITAFDSYAQWMFMHPDGRRWIGYRAGTYIADQAVAASGRSSADLVRMPTREILDLLE